MGGGWLRSGYEDGRERRDAGEYVPSNFDWKVNTLDPHLIHLHLVCYADIQEAEWWLVWQEEVK